MIEKLNDLLQWNVNTQTFAGKQQYHDLITDYVIPANQAWGSSHMDHHHQINKTQINLFFDLLLSVACARKIIVNIWRVHLEHVYLGAFQMHEKNV